MTPLSANVLEGKVIQSVRQETPNKIAIFFKDDTILYFEATCVNKDFDQYAIQAIMADSAAKPTIPVRPKAPAKPVPVLKPKKDPIVISVGPDETGAELPEGATWCIYWYEIGSYEGNGVAFAGNEKDEYWTKSLGHCSCYGPFGEDSLPWDQATLAEFRMSFGPECGQMYQKIKKKITQFVTL